MEVGQSPSFGKNAITIVIGKTHSKLRINLSSIMPRIDTGSTLHYSELMGHDIFGTFYRDTGSDSSFW